jgi:hypothetical protein
MIWFFRIAGRILSEADKAIIVAEMGIAEAAVILQFYS